MKYEEALKYLESIKSYGIVPGLERVRELCRRLGNPQDRLAFVHIAGTNGKGSVAAYLSTVLHTAGYRVGRYVSPVVFAYREQICVGKRSITRAALCEGVERIRDICDTMVREGMMHPSPYEIETALAFWYFEREKCDIVVLETCMGGLWDTTNVVNTTRVAVLTSIGRDHMQYLGNTLEEIASQKAGIIKPGCKVVSMEQKPEVMEVIKTTCKDKGCELTVSGERGLTHVRYGLERQSFDYGTMKKLEITLAGKFQIQNAVLAVEALKSLDACGFPISEKALFRGLKETRWPGRLAVIGKKPFFVVDGAHNEDAAEKLAESIEFYFTNRRIIYIMGMLKDKDCRRVIELTAKYADQIITVTPPENSRAMHAYELASVVSEMHPQVTAVDSLEEAVEMSYLLAGKEDVIIAFGSLSFHGRLNEIVKRHNEESVKRMTRRSR